MRTRPAVAAGLLVAVLVPTLSACSATHAAAPRAVARHSLPVPGGSAPLPGVSTQTSPAVTPSVRSVPPGTVIAPGATAMPGESAGVLPARQPAAGSAPPAGTLRELQMNLCDSGEAGCYTGGRAVDEAGALVRGAARPDMVTLNEVCRRDVVDRLGAVLAALWPSDDIVYLFAPAVNAQGGSYRCQNGDAFGNGLLARVPAGQLKVVDTRYGIFATQINDIERRSFGCVDLAPRFATCVAHLESDSASVAATQCTTLLSGVLPALRGAWGANLPLVVAGDMNLGDVTRCTPAGYAQAGDGGVQHVFGGPGTRIVRVDVYPMKQTDHSALLVTLALP